MRRFLTIQEHNARVAGLHWDLRLSKTNEPSDQLSWVLPKARLPLSGEVLLAIPVEDHPWSYRNFNGTIASGYGAGTVDLIYADWADCSKFEDAAITFSYLGKEYALRKTGTKWFILQKKATTSRYRYRRMAPSTIG